MEQANSGKGGGLNEQENILDQHEHHDGGAGDADFFEHLGGAGAGCELPDGEPEHHLGGRRV